MRKKGNPAQSINGLSVKTTDGSKIINSANQNLYISGEANSNVVPGIRTKMLTVWRNLHIEVDSMGDVGNNNRATGTISSIAQSTCPSPPGTCVVRTVYVISGILDENRFQGGRIQIGSQSFRVAANGFNTSAGSQVIFLDGTPSGSQTLSLPVNFTIYDDDDFNDDDGASMNGDAGENVDPPPTTLVTRSDTPCLDSSTATNCNVFAPAYVKPYYDLPGNETPFVLNVNVSTVNADPAPAEIQAHFQFGNSATESSSDFWTVYLNAAYQHDERTDADGDTSFISGIVDDLNGQGALIYMEVTRPHEFGTVATRTGVTRNHTVAHELGHLFFGTHNDTGVMQSPNFRSSGIFGVETLNKIRGGEFVNIRTGNTERITHP